MKQVLTALIFLFTINSFCFSQEEMRWDAKFALGGGFTPGWIFPNFDEVNKMMPGFGVENFTGGFFTTGGLGHISIAVVKNIRVGLMGFGGSLTNKSSLNGINKEAKYSASLLGFTAEYTFPFIPFVALSAGTVIGGGNTTLELFQYTGNYNWDQVWNRNGGTNALNENRKVSNSFFTVTPILNIEYPLNRFIALRIGGGYIIALGDNWKLNNGRAISNIPSGLTSNAAFIQAGIFIGYFNY